MRFVECNLSSNDRAKIRRFPDTTKFQRVIGRDFQYAFNPKPVKQSNSPFCAPQLILFQRRKHRVKEKKTQHLIQYSVIQFFLRGYFSHEVYSSLLDKLAGCFLFIFVIIYSNRVAAMFLYHLHARHIGFSISEIYHSGERDRV